MDYQVFIPTYGRAGHMKTHEVFPDAVIVCPDSQLEDYKKHYPDLEYMTFPVELEGNMARKRNFIMKNAQSDWIVMLDDDLDGFGYIERGKQMKMDYQMIKEVFDNGFRMCEEAGTVLWGLNLQTDPKFYREYSPISFLSPVLGPFSAHIRNSKCKYDERLPLKEDYDYSLQVLREYRKILRFNKYAYYAGHLNNSSGGGYMSFRRMDEELRQNKLLQKKWGSDIVKFDMKKSVNPRIRVPYKGI